MHDNSTVAFEIKSPFREKPSMFFPKGDYRKTLITIWHIDPEKDGTDDSCGWYMRTRHGDKKVLDEIKKDFDYNFKHNYWFDKDGKQIFSTIGTLVQMYGLATFIYFKKNRKKHERFMRKHLYDIIHSAENPIDCVGDNITNKWRCENIEERFESLANIIYADILNWSRKWYQHPRWHINHWSIQWNFIEDLFSRKKKEMMVQVCNTNTNKN